MSSLQGQAPGLQMGTSLIVHISYLGGFLPYFFHQDRGFFWYKWKCEYWWSTNGRRYWRWRCNIKCESQFLLKIFVTHLIPWHSKLGNKHVMNWMELEWVSVFHDEMHSDFLSGGQGYVLCITTNGSFHVKSFHNIIFVCKTAFKKILLTIFGSHF